MPVDETPRQYRLRVVRLVPDAMTDSYDDGRFAAFDAVVFEIVEGGSGELTVYFPQSGKAPAKRFKKGAIVTATTSEPDLQSLDVIFSGALQFED